MVHRLQGIYTSYREAAARYTVISQLAEHADAAAKRGDRTTKAKATENLIVVAVAARAFQD